MDENVDKKHIMGYSNHHISIEYMTMKDWDDE